MTLTTEDLGRIAEALDHYDYWGSLREEDEKRLIRQARELLRLARLGLSLESTVTGILCEVLDNTEDFPLPAILGDGTQVDGPVRDYMQHGKESTLEAIRVIIGPLTLEKHFPIVGPAGEMPPLERED